MYCTTLNHAGYLECNTIHVLLAIVSRCCSSHIGLVTLSRALSPNACTWMINNPPHVCLLSGKPRIHFLGSFRSSSALSAILLIVASPRSLMIHFAHTSRSKHHITVFLIIVLLLTPVISLLAKPTPQVYCSYVPQHILLSFLSCSLFFQLAARARS